jgi:lipopolysaccharide/colanic/teichoic acid biosynthesis glycosyltransferase
MTHREVQSSLPSNLIDRAVQMGAENGLLLHRAFARLRDLSGALSALILLSPALVLLGAAARLSTGSSALFRQVRVGTNGQNFVVNKFRTLRPEAPAQVNKRKAEHLATPAGRLMRRFKLDELPQLWNVVRGDMSLVGPRPIIPGEYSDTSHYQRLTVRPGLTGLWQLSRVREEPFDRNPEYDLFYVANRSLSFDFWLIWRTVLLLLTRRETKIRLAARLWERNPAWRQLVPERARAIPPRTGPLRSKLWLAGGLAALLVLITPGIALAIVARGDLIEGRSAMLQARQAMRRLEPEAAAVALDRASESFDRAHRKFSSWPTLGARAIPGLNQNLEVPRALSKVGTALVEAGRAGVEVIGKVPLERGQISPPLKGGVLDLVSFTEAAEPAERLRSHLVDAERRIARTPRHFLIPPVAESRREVTALLSHARHQADVAAAAALLVPRILGAEGPRTWVVGAENTAELRGRGGYLGSFGLLSVEHGRFALGEFRALADLPLVPQDPVEDSPAELREYERQYLALGGLATAQNLLMSPDFPLGASMLLSHLQSAAGIDADGLVSIDPTALSYLLGVTGPVIVEGIPEPLTSNNIVDWALNRIYLLYQDDHHERRERLSQITEAVWDKLLSAGAIDSRAVSQALGRAFLERHLVLYSTDPQEQALIERLGISGRVEETDGDYLLVASQNTGENKMDFYKSRKVTYTGKLGWNGTLDAQVQVTVSNTATPGTTFPDYVGGARPGIELGPGRSRDFLSLFVPARAELRQVLRNGMPSSDFDNSLELGKRRLAAYVELGAGESQTLTFRYRLPLAISGGEYKLMVQNQASIVPDRLSVQIQPPSGASIQQRTVFERGDSLSWTGEARNVLRLSADIGSPMHARIAAWLAPFLRQPVGDIIRLVGR